MGIVLNKERGTLEFLLETSLIYNYIFQCNVKLDPYTNKSSILLISHSHYLPKLCSASISASSLTSTYTYFVTDA